MTKVYAVYRDSYTNLDGSSLDSIWTTEESANDKLTTDAKTLNLKPSKMNKKVLTNGDIFMYVATLFLNTKWLYGEPDET